MDSIFHVISFHPNGTTSCFWTEAIPLHELGTLEVNRASNIEFNQQKQQWEVEVNGKVLFSNASRALCHAWEIQYFNRCPTVSV